VPVSADFENGFADEPEGVAESVRLAAGVGLAEGTYGFTRLAGTGASAARAAFS
jgi:hypothetical protein